MKLRKVIAALNARRGYLSVKLEEWEGQKGGAFHGYHRELIALDTAMPILENALQNSDEKKFTTEFHEESIE